MEKDLIALIEEFLLQQSDDIKDTVFFQQDVGGVKYEFVLELPDNIPTKSSISGGKIIDVKKTTENTVVNVQRVFPDGDTIVDYSFNARGKGGDVEAYKKFNKILKEGKGMKGVVVEYFDTFPVETSLLTTAENDITIPDTPEGIEQPKIYHGSAEPRLNISEFSGAKAGNYLHGGTYQAAVDRRSGAFAGQSIWNLGNTINSYFEEVVGFNGELREHYDSFIERGTEPSDIPKFRKSVEYTITTDKDYTSQAHLVAEMNDDYIVNVRLDYTESVLDGIRETVDPTFAEVMYDEVNREYDNYTTRPLNWQQKIQQNVPEPFSVSFIHEIKPKPDAVIEVLDEYYILASQDPGYNTVAGSADVILNDYEQLTKGTGARRIDWDNFEDVFSGSRADVMALRSGDMSVIMNLKNMSRPEFMKKLNNADIFGYINDVEDPGSISYAVKNFDAVDIELMSVDDNRKFQLDIDNKSMEMNTTPYNLYDEAGELIDYADETIQAYSGSITSQFNRANMRTPKDYSDDRLVNYSEIKNQIPYKGPGTGMGPGAALADNSFEFINKLPIEQSIKDKTIERITKHTAGLAAKTATPDPMQALDIYEDFVMLAGLAYAFAPDVGTFVKNQANNMLETMANAAGYNVKLQDFEYDWERVSDTMDWVESVSPTDIVINKVGDLAKGAAETGMITGFGYVPKNLNSTLGNTLTSATTTKEKERDPMYDRISRTFSGKY